MAKVDEISQLMCYLSLLRTTLSFSIDPLQFVASRHRMCPSRRISVEEDSC